MTLVRAMAAMALGAASVQGFALVNAAGPCALTPEAALLAAQGQGGAGTAQGYRVVGVRRDPLLRQGWAVVASCDHPEQSPLLLKIGSAEPVLRQVESTIQNMPPMIRAGEVVRLWRRESYVHIEMIATAEESGAVGSKIRLRLPVSQGLDGQVGQSQFAIGVVRGPADVELEP
ncbi:MAG TPA: hypothetical protein VGC07_04300 [Granulicella sp.]